MLLLVLILVLIAFGLLIVALLSGSVLWAWVSVGVSVAAAAVLLIDWLQRRSALKAGAEAASAAPAAESPRTRTTPEMEPVTEVLPVVPRSGAGAEAGRSDQDGADHRFGEPPDATRTVVMPVVQPSASGERPPSASHDATSSGGDSSPTVTKPGSARSTSTPSEAPGAETSAAPASPPGSDAAPPTSVTPAAADVQHDEGDGRPPDVPAAGAAPSDSAPPREQETGGEPAEVAGAAQSGAAAGPASGPPAGEAAVGGAAVGTDASAGGEASNEAEPAAASTPAVDEEPPEEPRDPEAAALVAALETDVLVIDEQPRYHLTGCRALAGKEQIPLPAREAVELGFTPCGWCTPDRTLARQEAPVR